ncbi:inositol 1,4,5-triphosphate receptor associated 2 [Talpa occidentalis]|uniref:inositol 1,4,5-triphosphate receptor associated 2 n=1 Tax=Talpa occidentalis TaxID=50954 RepID=UPI0023F669D6|nr:inositol 1,4,5-triphosphate receptor associated 2 [Talpa occidentalis]
MASSRKAMEKRHNPVESICRKIKAIQKGEGISNPIRQIVRYQLSSFDNPQNNAKKDFEEVLKKMTAAHTSVPTTHFSSSEKDVAFIASPRTPSSFHLSSPENATYSVTLTSSENTPSMRSQDSQNYTSLISQIKKGSIEANHLIDYLKQTFSQDSEGGGFELWNMLDADKRDPQVDLETFQDTMKEWVTSYRKIWEGVSSGPSGSIQDSDFEQDGRKSGRAIMMTTDTTYSTPGYLEALDGDVSKGILKETDLITHIAELHFNKQKLEEEIIKFKLALETLEEANSQLSEDRTELCLQVKSAHQAILRTNLLKEELEELKTSMDALEEQKTMTVAQNKQLEAENRALIHKIRNLQEENTMNMMEIHTLEKKIEELCATEREHQMQLHMYENTLLHKDACLQKKDIHIEELKSTITEYERVIENLREDKNKLAGELQHLQQVLITNAIHLNGSGKRNSFISEGAKPLCCELILAQSAENPETEWQCSLINLSTLDTMVNQEMRLFLEEHGQQAVHFTAKRKELHDDVSEIETLFDDSLQWVANPETTVNENWGNKLTEFKHTTGEKLNLCITLLNSLRNDKESLDKEFVRLIEILERLSLEYFYFNKEFLSRQKLLETIKQLQEDAVDQEAILRKKVQEVHQRPEESEGQVKEQDEADHPAGEKARSWLHKLEEAISEQRTLQTINTELASTCQTLEQTPRKLQSALYLESLTAIPRLGLTPSPGTSCHTHVSSEGPTDGEIKVGALDVTRRHNSARPTGGPYPGMDLPGCISMNNGPSVEEDGVSSSCSGSLPQSREYTTLPSPGHAASSESTVTSSDAGSEILNMASGDLDCKSLCEKEEDTQSASAAIKIRDRNANDENSALQGSGNEAKTMIRQEAQEEPETIHEHKKECATEGTAVSPPPATTVKSVSIRQNDNTSANEKEVEAEFLRLSLAFKCDCFTLEKRVKLEERSRDLAEENLKQEITNCLKLLESLTPLCEDDNQVQEVIKKLEKSITFLSQCTARVASRAEMLGAINQESRVSKSVEVMIQHVENLKRMYAKEHAELEELKQVLLQNERSFNPLEDEDDCQVKKRPTSLNSKPSSLRRVTIASLPRNIGNVGMVTGMENERFSRRSSSWRILGSKQSEHRPSLQRFISTYSWADAEEEKRELKTKEESEAPEEETVERTRKPSLSEKKNNPSKWDVSSVHETMTSWATSLKTTLRNTNKALWLSAAFAVLLAALMSFLTSRLGPKSVEAAPTQEGDSWMSLEHILWPFTRLHHNGPPPV